MNEYATLPLLCKVRVPLPVKPAPELPSYLAPPCPAEPVWESVVAVRASFPALSVPEPPPPPAINKIEAVLLKGVLIT